MKTSGRHHCHFLICLLLAGGFSTKSPAVSSLPDINYSYDAGDGFAKPPPSFGFSYIASGIDFYHWGWPGAFTPMSQQIAIVGAAEHLAAYTGHDGGCFWGPKPSQVGFPEGAAGTVTANSLTFDNGTKGFVGAMSLVHGGGILTVKAVTNRRTIQLSTSFVRWGGSVHPFVLSNGRKLWFGYMHWTNSGPDEGLYYKSIPMADQEYLISVGGVSQVTDNAGCGGAVQALRGTYAIDSGLRLRDESGNSIPIASEPVGYLNNALRLRKPGSTLGLFLVPTIHPQASPYRIQTPSGVMSIQTYVP